MMNCISFWKVVVRNFDDHSLQPRLGQLRRNVVIEDFLHRQCHNDGMVVFEEAIYLAQGIFGVVEGDEEAFLAPAAAHGGLEGVNVRAANFVLLLYLDWIPAFVQGQFIRFRADGFGPDREDAAINAHVADLGFVRDAAQGDDGPVLELEWRDGAGLLHRSKEVAHDEPAPDSPKLFALGQPANILVAQSLRHYAACRGRDVYADPLPLEVLSR